MRPRAAAALLLLLVGLFTLLAGCGGDRNSTVSTRPIRPGFGAVHLRLTDAPADYDQVNIVVREVRVHQADFDDDDGEGGGWIVISDTETTYDLLELRNGVSTTLGVSENVPVGHYDQIRLVLGSGSNVVVDGVTYPLTTPSGMQSGLKVNGEFDVVEGETRELLLDFDAARSVHVTGNQKYMLRPVIKLVEGDIIPPPPVDPGAIHGDLDPATEAEILARIGDETFATAAPDTTGVFTLANLTPGTYDVRIDVASGYRDTTLTGVVVTSGQTTELGIITLSPDTTTSDTTASVRAVAARRQ
jgi:hypothetical protein